MFPRRIEKKFAFLIDEYGMKYEELTVPFHGDKNMSVWCFCFYNSNGAFTICYYHWANEDDFFKSDKFSTDYRELLKENIDEEVWAVERKTKAYFLRPYKRLAVSIKKELKNNPVLFGIPLTKTNSKK